MHPDDTIKMDSEHKVVSYLKNGATLHRFKNPAGIDYSAIYTKEGYEMFSCPRAKEDGMIKEWNSFSR